MRRTTALVWKEWREQTCFLYGGLAVFLICPLLVMVGYLWMGTGPYSQSYIPEGMVLGMGWLLAIIVGVGATCRDLSSRLQSFWQSRPVSLCQWLVVKYGVGLAVVLLVCLIPIGLEMGFAVLLGQRPWWKDKYTESVIYCAPFAVTLMFSVAFFLGCLVRRAAQAAVLAVAGGLFVYFLPTLIPPLAGLGVINVMENVFWDRASSVSDLQYSRFVTAMLVGSGFALMLSNLALKRDWRVQADKRIVVGTLGMVFLLLGSVSAFQVGTNLTCLESHYVNPLNRPHGSSRAVSRIIASGRRGVLILYDQPLGYVSAGDVLTSCSFDLSVPGAGYGNETPLNAGQGYQGIGRAHGVGNPLTLIWSETRPNRAYFLSTTERRAGVMGWRDDPVLMTIATDAPPDQAVINRLDLSSYGDSSQICEYKGRLYLWCGGPSLSQQRVLVIDLSQPDTPRVAEVLESPGELGVRSQGNAYEADYEVKGVWLPRIEGLNRQERLELVSRLTLGWTVPAMSFSDGLLVAADASGLSTFRLTGIEEDFASFKRAGRYRRTLLEDALMRQAYRVVLSGGLAYTLDGHGLTVFDVRRPEYPRRVGHYASAGDWFGDVVPLPDGRILVGGRKLHILAPPKVD